MQVAKLSSSPLSMDLSYMATGLVSTLTITKHQGLDSQGPEDQCL